MPINTRYKGEEAAGVIRTAEVKLLFTVTDFLGADYIQLLAGLPGLGWPGRDRRHERSCLRQGDRLVDVPGPGRAGHPRRGQGAGGGDPAGGLERHHLHLGHDGPSQGCRATPRRQRRDLRAMVTRGGAARGRPRAGHLPLLPHGGPQIRHPGRLHPGSHARAPSRVRRPIGGRPGRRGAHHRTAGPPVHLPIDPQPRRFRLVPARHPAPVDHRRRRRPGRADRPHEDATRPRRRHHGLRAHRNPRHGHHLRAERLHRDDRHHGRAPARRPGAAHRGRRRGRSTGRCARRGARPRLQRHERVLQRARGNQGDAERRRMARHR